MSAPILELDNVTISYEQNGRWLDAVRNVSFSIEAGQTYGLVGESGSGKSTLAYAVMRYLSENGKLRSGRILINGQDISNLNPQEMRRVWREQIKMVPQNPLPSMNPAHKVGDQLAEVITATTKNSSGSVTEQVLALFSSVGLADAARVAASYPHELSGGMQQRVMIAMALAVEPALLVLDEPTTNLDVTTEATILDLIKTLITERQTAVLFVSHSLGVIAQVCDRVAVLYAGELVEDAPVKELYRQPLHPYTRGLLDSVPRVGQDKRQVSLRPIPGQIPDLNHLPAGCVFLDRCPIAIDTCAQQRPALFQTGNNAHLSRCFRWEEIANHKVSARQEKQVSVQHDNAEQSDAVLDVTNLEKRFTLPRSLIDAVTNKPPAQVKAVNGVSLTLRRNRTLGLVGESGSGKSTLSRCIIGLIEANDGSMTLLDMPLARSLNARDTQTLQHLQMVFQSSDEALNPYLTVEQTLRRPLTRLLNLSPQQANERVRQLLAAVKLNASYAGRLPGQLSGGEKQRVAIARAFASQPDLIVFDESVSGLDVSVQAAILNLLGQLQQDYDNAYLFISHDLSVVSYLADDIAVIYLGQLMQIGQTRDILEPPYHPYTEALLSAIPLIDPEAKRESIRLEGDVPSPVDVPQGCPFHSRCPRFLGDICVTQTPPWQQDERGNKIFCHIPLEELKAQQRRVFRFIKDPNDDRENGAQASSTEVQGG